MPRNSLRPSLLACLIASSAWAAFRLLVDDMRRDTSLDVDRRHRMRHHVVQFAGDPQPFGIHRAPGLLCALPESGATAGRP